MITRRHLAAALLIALAATQVTACSSEQLASSFRSWCRTADNCDDNSRPRSP